MSSSLLGIIDSTVEACLQFAEFLVEQGINSISLNADTVLKTTLAIDAFEKRNNLQ